MTVRRTESEIANEITSLRKLQTHPAIVARNEEDADLATLECIRTQIRVLERNMSYPALLTEYEDSEKTGAQEVLGSAYDAWRWLNEDGELPSEQWTDAADVWASTTPDAVVVRILGGNPAPYRLQTGT